MLLTVIGILAILALLLTIAAATNPPKCPLWVPVLLLCVIELLRVLPIGR